MLNANATSRYARFPGVLVNRLEVGAACVDLLVGMLYRNEKGIPKKAHELMVETSWHPGAGFP